MATGKNLSFKTVSLLLAVVIVSGLTYARWTGALTLEERCQAYKEKAGPNLKKLDLNKATEEELKVLPGVGIKTARAIVDHRKAIGGYKSLEQLKRVRGVGDKLYECLKDLVFVKNPPTFAP
jgi:comEA protein